ncbi:MAG: hypothetical protein ABSA03_03800 [Streptosporangiaceae bacterium]
MSPLLPPGRRRRAVLIAAAAAAVVAVSAALVVPGGAPRAGGVPGAGSIPAGGRGPSARVMTRVVSVVAGPAATVELQAAQGQLTIVGSATGVVTLTGQLHWTGHAPIASTRLNRVAGILRLSYQCAAASPCGGNYRLVVPRRTAVVLHEPSGHVIITGLAGPLRITARSVDVSATALRSPSLAAWITSGHLSAAFDAAPRRVSITLLSAQATLRLPPGAAYAVRQRVTSGYVDVGIPRAAGAARTITARINSGELRLLPGL